MATYFHGNTELQSGGDGLQTLILMNPSYIGFSDNNGQQTNQQQNQSSNGNNNLVYLPHAPQHFVGIPLSTSSAQDHDAGFAPTVQYNLYNLPIDAGPPRAGQPPPQGLSLSLSPQQAYAMPSRGVAGASPPRGDDVRGGLNSISPSSGCGVSNNGPAQNQVFLGSNKYLKAAQELLDEVVNVGKDVKGLEPASNKARSNGVGETSAAASAPSPGDCDGGGKRGAELSTVEKQEIQMKKAKLVNMLDEVEQRYRQYHHQMNIVITLFERAAGLGSAKTYTALALQTISKQFRCLKDAILAQIRAASKSLGEEDTAANEGRIEGSRLKYVDNQIRQQRALQQLGMVQNNAWRPQRGLPERAVSVLRAWLFEHFLHPYPKDSDKIMLAKQTGLTRSQVSNWFINARVRLWKPMVEEMYVDETKGQDKNGSEGENDGDKAGKGEQNEDSTRKSAAPHVKSPGRENQSANFMKNQENPISAMSNSSTSPNVSPGCFNLIGSSDMESIRQGSSKKQRSNAFDLLQPPPSGIASMKFDYERTQSREGFTLMGAPTNFIGGFGTYPIGELGRYGAEAFQAPYSGNGAVSLTLGLPHCENNLSITAGQPSFMPDQGMRRVHHEIDETNGFSGLNDNANAHSSNVYEAMNIQDRKRFVAQLLPDFVS